MKNGFYDIDAALLCLIANSKSKIDLPFFLQRDAFCAGYIQGARNATRKVTAPLQYDLGSTKQIDAICSAVREASDDQFKLNGTYRIITSGIKGRYGKRIPMGEVDDSDPPTTSALHIKMAFISGYQTAEFISHKSQELPIEFFQSFQNNEEACDAIDYTAAELLDILTD